MTWTETNRRQQALREALAMIEQRRDGRLPWHEDWYDVFGDQEGLLSALSHRWRRQREGQLDPALDDVGLAEARRRLQDQNVGLIAVLARHDDRRSVDVA
ncbi:hypothetical protein ASD11_07495 [Aeromicrobium sp. Root495]|uniref:hypothetical protein n=1 Tax=Aeromicrobium sp. Root495 TaxID=1736550 RepID=UPI0006FC88FA|nr:hypothetical protein [Aeromicrobium sp. Root495]KQY59403.1 hypothetical protein ASD11_07495 [Aeromicrobium sp. Root495]